MAIIGILLIIYAIISIFIEPPLEFVLTNYRILFIIQGITLLIVSNLYKKINYVKRDKSSHLKHGQHNYAEDGLTEDQLNRI